MLKVNVNLLNGECLNTFCIIVDLSSNIAISKNVHFFIVCGTRGKVCNGAGAFTIQKGPSIPKMAKLVLIYE